MTRRLVLSVSRAAVIGVVVATLFAACGGSGSGGGGGTVTGPPSGNSVTVSNNVFNPKSTTVTTGSAVTWDWSSGGVTHNVTFDDGVTSGNKSSGSYTRTFTAAGTYPYHCTIHGLAMSGSVVVQ